MTLLEFVKSLNLAIVILFTLLYLYQGFYIVVGLVRRRWTDRYQPKKLHRFAAIVSARNEEAVIGELLESLQRQNYPQELLDLYVVADNCTDNTAATACQAGAFVYERFDQKHKGKGYAIDYLFRRLKEERKDVYDGYFVFDADNLVDRQLRVRDEPYLRPGIRRGDLLPELQKLRQSTGSPPDIPSGSCGRPGSSTSPAPCWAPTAMCRAPAFWCPPR